jgi:hypothetical protein
MKITVYLDVTPCILVTTYSEGPPNFTVNLDEFPQEGSILHCHQ